MKLDPTLVRLVTANDDLLRAPIDWPKLRAAGKAGLSGVVGESAVTPVKSVDDVQIKGKEGDIRMRVYKPLETPLMTFIHIHGGGWATGDLDNVDHVVRNLCRELPAIVVSVTYRLAPEHAFPAGYEDALLATRWVLEHCREFGGDPATVVIGGDSAGANLAAAVAIGLRDEAAGNPGSDQNLPALKGQLLLYPATDLRPSAMTATSCIADADPSLPVKFMDECSLAYLQGASGEDYRASPILADLAGLPRALVVVLSVDPLRDSGIAYAERLDAAGVHTEVIEFPHLTHGFAHLINVVPAAREAFAEVVIRFRRMMVQDS
ncbi:alpha/beta hydrolase [Massilia sp.]|uniref:alpha/beta hydrolase n=1 Tax=Massilia sp. TaxID=1882437 RepID=UPI00352E410B